MCLLLVKNLPENVTPRYTSAHRRPTPAEKANKIASDKCYASCFNNLTGVSFANVYRRVSSFISRSTGDSCQVERCSTRAW